MLQIYNQYIGENAVSVMILPPIPTMYYNIA